MPVPGAARALDHLHRAGHRLWIVTKRDRQRLYKRLREAELPIERFSGMRTESITWITPLDA